MTWLETRGMLAKLLATENLVVIHNANANTASFNTETRELTLPILKTESENVYNLFVAHECSHALNTPPDWVDKVDKDIPFDFINVCEDVRIEKLIQDKFPGLRYDFTRGYDKLYQDDFFSIKDKNLNELNLIDRINIHFKLGARALVPFTDEEMVYVTAVDEADTFDKVLLVSKMLADYVKSKRNEKLEDIPQEGQSKQQNNNTDGDKQESKSESESESQQSDENGESPEQNDSKENDSQTSNELQSQTQQEFDSKLSQLTRGNRDRLTYVKPPQESLDFIIDVNELRESFSDPDPLSNYHNDLIDRFYQYLDSIKRDVNFMVQQFEMKKSADAYARTSVHKTGELNMNALHEYKLTEDIFLRQNVTPDGKNHGMIMYLDWSGSMDHIAHNTVKQILMLVQFCRKVQIPFEVYTFTSNNERPDGSSYTSDMKGQIVMKGVVHMVQVLSSSVKKTQLEQDMLNLWFTSFNNAYTPYSYHLSMGGTPLDNALFALPTLVARFRDNTKAQKVSFVCITDGESTPLISWGETAPYSDGKVYGRATYGWGERMMVRDGARVIALPVGRECSGHIAKYLESIIPDLSVTTFFLGTVTTCSRYSWLHNQVMNQSEFKKQNATSVTTEDAWPVIVLVSPKAFGDAQDEILVEAGAKKTQIKNALKKYLASKSSNKMVLSTLADQFA